MSLDEREEARKMLEEAMVYLDLMDPFQLRLMTSIKEAEEVGLSYEEIVKIIVSYLE